MPEPGQGTSPRLSICIPTHDGRAQALGQALDSVIGQVDARLSSRLEVCVSDNASQDRTAGVVERAARRSPVPLSYRRNVADLGAARNILAAVEMATGDYCWILSSDDLLVSGAIDRVLNLLAAHPGIAGMTVSLRLLDPGSGAFHPAALPDIRPVDRDPVVYAGAARIVEQLGLLFSGISQHVFDRRAWAHVARVERTDVLGGLGLFPHVVVIGQMIRRSPRWLWCADPLVLYRLSPTERVAAAPIIDFVADLWRALARAGGQDAAGASMSRILEPAFCARSIIVLRSRPDYDRHLHLRLTRLLIARRRLLGGFWSEIVPVLVLPRRALFVPRVVERAARAARRVASRLRHPAHPGVRLEASEPVGLATDQAESIAVRVTSERWPLLTWWPVFPLYVSYRWRRDGTELDPRSLPTPIRKPVTRGRPAELTVRVLPPAQPGRYELTLALEWGGEWLGERPSASAWRRVIDVEPPAGAVAPHGDEAPMPPTSAVTPPVPRTAPSR